MKKEFAKDLFRIAHNRHRNDKKLLGLIGKTMLDQRI